MTNTIKYGLQEIVRDYGRNVLHEPDRLEALLADFAPGSQSERQAVVAVVRSGLIDELQKRAQEQDPNIVDEMVRRIAGTLEPESARLAIEACAYALGTPVGSSTGLEPTSPVTTAVGLTEQSAKKSARRQPPPKPGSSEERELFLQAAKEIISGKPGDTAKSTVNIIAARKWFKSIPTVVSGLVTQGVPQDSARVLVGYSMKEQGTMRGFPFGALVVFVIIECYLVIDSGNQYSELPVLARMVLGVVLFAMLAAVGVLRSWFLRRKGQELLGEYAKRYQR
jgi:hypothetical protein